MAIKIITAKFLSKNPVEGISIKSHGWDSVDKTAVSRTEGKQSRGQERCSRVLMQTNGCLRQMMGLNRGPRRPSTTELLARTS